MGAEHLYTEYALSLPREWKLAEGRGRSCTRQDDTSRMRRGLAESRNSMDNDYVGELSDVDEKEDIHHDEFAAGGTTQVTCSLFDEMRYFLGPPLPIPILVDSFSRPCRKSKRHVRYVSH